MLEERIEEARRRSARRRKQITIGLLAVIGLCAVVVIGLSSFDFSVRENVSVVKKNAPVLVLEEVGPSEGDIEKVRDECKEILRQYENELEQTLMQAEILLNYSFAIKRQSEELRELIIKLDRLIPVTVFSDNETYVSVRGVGRVGTVSQKKIELKPGSYTFEGARDGFKSILVKVFIPSDRDNFTVRVLCDEPI